MSNTLTNSIRDKIVNHVIDTQFKESNAKIQFEENDLAYEVYKRIFDFELIDVEKVGHYWFNMQTCITVQVGFERHYLEFKYSLPLPYNTEHRNDFQRMPADSKLGEKVIAFSRKKESHKAEKRAARDAVRTLLYSVRTFAQLRKVWPEGEQFYKAYDIERETSSLPAVQITQLNQMLGIEKVGK